MLKSTVAGNLSMNGADIAEAGAVGGASSEGEEEMDQEAHDRKQANMQSQLQSLNDMLSQKEALASNMMANEEKMQEMRDKYEKSLASLQEELATLQQEKDKLDIQTKSSKNNDPTCKIETITPKRADQLTSSPTSFTKNELKEVLPEVHLDKQCTPDTMAEETAKIPGCDAEYWREKFVPSRSRVLRRSSSLPKVQPKKKTFSLPRPRFFLREENSRSDRPDENKPALRKRLYNATGAWFFGKGFNNKKEQSAQD